jgi:hypothetical protein
MDHIAVIRLAPGEVGFFDPHTKIHLTMAKQTAPVYPGPNLDGIRRSVKSKRLMLISGTLDTSKPIIQEAVPAVKAEEVAVPVAIEVAAAPEEIAVIEPVAEEIVIEEAAIEVADEVAVAAEDSDAVAETKEVAAPISGKGKSGKGGKGSSRE